MPASEPIGPHERLFSVKHERLFSVMSDNAPVGVFLTDADGACVYMNKRLAELVGLTGEQGLGAGWEQALHPEDAGWVHIQWVEAAAAGKDFLAEYRFLRTDGSVRWVEGSAAAVRDEEGELLGWVGCCVDLTSRKQSDERYRELFERATDSIFAANLQGEITAINRAGEALTGYGRDQLVGMSMFDLIVPEDRERALETFQLRLAGVESERAEYQLISKHGGRVFAEVAGRLIDHDGQPAGFEAIVRDTSERHALEEKLRKDALHDPLTGLPNRRLFHDRLGQALARVARSGSRVAVMFLDLDEFKLVNGRLGHNVGDVLLVLVALRLQPELRGYDSVARLGGNEFGLLIEDFSSEQELVDLAERLLATVAVPAEINHSQLQITASLGITIAEVSDTAESALTNAEAAMHKAKAAGTGRFKIYNDATHPPGNAPAEDRHLGLTHVDTTMPQKPEPASIEQPAPVDPSSHTYFFEGVEVQAFHSDSEWRLHAGGHETDSPDLVTAATILFDPRHYGDPSSLIQEILDREKRRGAAASAVALIGA